MRRSIRARAALATAVTALTLTALAAAPVAAAKPASPAGPPPEPMHIEVTIGNEYFCGVYGEGAPGAKATITLTRDGEVIRKQTVEAFQPGGFIIADWPCGAGRVGAPRIGDRVSAVSGDQRTSLAVRDLRPRFNLANDTVNGTAPLGRVEITILDCVIGLDCQGDRIYRFPRQDADGRWTVDTDQFDLRGGDAVVVDWFSRRGNRLTQKIVAPHITVEAGSPAVTGHGTPGRTVTATLFAPDGTFKGTGSARVKGSGRFLVTLRSDGAPVAPAPGDTVTSSVFRDASITLLPNRLQVDAATSDITNTCRSNAQYLVRLKLPDGYSASGGHADRRGAILEQHMAFGDLLPLRAQDRARMWCATLQGNSQLFIAYPS